MKTILRSLLFFCILMCVARSVHAQGCRTIYFANYSTYTTESSDGTNMYTTVLTDGSTTGGPPGPGCPMGPAFHYATSTNAINSVGGTMNGAHQCVGCYLSVQNNQQVAAADGVGHNVYGVGTVICSVVGTWWGSAPVQLFMHHANANYQYSGLVNNNTECNFNLACPNGNGAATCGVQVPWIHWPLVPLNGVCTTYLHDKRFVVGGRCIPIGDSVPATTPINCN
jgi:hypothetical protein